MSGLTPKGESELLEDEDLRDPTGLEPLFPFNMIPFPIDIAVIGGAIPKKSDLIGSGDEAETFRPGEIIRTEE